MYPSAEIAKLKGKISAQEQTNIIDKGLKKILLTGLMSKKLNVEAMVTQEDGLEEAE